VYRWLSLLPVVWFLGQPSTGPAPFWLFIIAVALSLAISLLYQRPSFLKHPFVLGFDILIMAILLALSGVSHSPYLLHALSPLLMAASFFHLRGALLAAGGFATLYLAILLVGERLDIQLEGLLLQVGGMGLISGLVGQMAALGQRLREAEQKALVTGNGLNQQIQQLNRRCQLLSEQISTLSAAHHQLEIIHDMAMLLQGATDILTIEQRILRAVIAEAGSAQALIGLVNPATHKLDRWQVYPDNSDLLAVLYPLPLTSESGLLVEELLHRRGGWWFNNRPLVSDDLLNAWFSRTPWLSLPLILKEEPVGVLLVAVEGGPPALSEEQLVVLSAIASQAALALSTIDRVKQLVIEQERNRIARDIHDTVTQSLFGIVFTLEACIKMLPEQPTLVHEELIELRNLAEQVRQEMRQSIHNLWPAELTLEQFKADLRQYVSHCSGSSDFQVDFTIGGDFEALPLQLRRDLYRVAQEALANVARHARVNSARVSLMVEPHEVQLSIRDHGKGFDPKTALAGSPERFGLRGIRERVQALHGTCEILSQVDQGAQILVRVPRAGL
jgi:signal transduction histidine kinase